VGLTHHDIRVWCEMGARVFKVVVDFPGHTTQQPLKVKVEHGPGVAASALPALEAELERRLREALAFKAEVELVEPDTFEKPGVQKVSLIERVR
jgi:phenylacetate-CoA ligase